VSRGLLLRQFRWLFAGAPRIRSRPQRRSGPGGQSSNIATQRNAKPRRRENTKNSQRSRVRPLYIVVAAVGLASGLSVFTLKERKPTGEPASILGSSTEPANPQRAQPLRQGSQASDRSSWGAGAHSRGLPDTQVRAAIQVNSLPAPAGMRNREAEAVLPRHVRTYTLRSDGSFTLNHLEIVTPKSARLEDQQELASGYLRNPTWLRVATISVRGAGPAAVQPEPFPISDPQEVQTASRMGPPPTTTSSTEPARLPRPRPSL
jgi:hypothetical protein